jgi:hypothetical protein
LIIWWLLEEAVEDIVELVVAALEDFSLVQDIP